jgi:hypothetical protein
MLPPFVPDILPLSSLPPREREASASNRVASSAGPSKQDQLRRRYHHYGGCATGGVPHPIFFLAVSGTYTGVPRRRAGGVRAGSCGRARGPRPQAARLPLVLARGPALRLERPCPVCCALWACHTQGARTRARIANCRPAAAGGRQSCQIGKTIPRVGVAPAQNRRTSPGGQRRCWPGAGGDPGGGCSWLPRLQLAPAAAVGSRGCGRRLEPAGCSSARPGGSSCGPVPGGSACPEATVARRETTQRRGRTLPTSLLSFLVALTTTARCRM